MRKVLIPALLATLLASAGTAAAGGLPLAAEQNPPKYVDEAELVVYLMKRDDDGYAFRVFTYIYGIGSKSDAARIQWISKGKVVADQRCPLQIDGDTAKLSCDWEGKPINASGDVTVNLIFIDDQAEKEFLLRTFNLKIMKFTWMKDHQYQVMHDDNLGTAYVWHRMTGDEFKRGDHQWVFYFWMATNSSPPDAQLRCTVNGKRIDDFQASIQTNGYDIEGLYHVKGEERRYHWSPMIMVPDRLYYGEREELKKHFNRTDEEIKNGEWRITAELAGDWDCNLRSGGNVVRRFLFKVNDKGRIEPSPAQSAAGFPKLLPSVVWVDMRLPEKNAFDGRVRPDAIKKAMRYGQPWPKHEAFEAAKKALPPASGLADPK